jgi:hypothetical protein
MATPLILLICSFLTRRSNGQKTVGCFTSFTILANNFLPLNLALYNQGELLLSATSNIKSLFLWLRKKAHQLDRGIVFSFHILAISFLGISTILLITLTVSQFNGTGIVNQLSHKISFFFLEMAGIDPTALKAQEYKQILSALVGSIAVSVTLWFAVVTVVNHRHTKSVLRRQALIETRPVYTDGVEDLNYMHEYFQNASSVTVFSGDFSWLSVHQELQEEVKRLALEEKIRLISSKSMKLVKQAIGNDEIFNSLRSSFKFESGMDLKCSLVHNNSNSAFLYKVDRSYEKGSKSVCIINGHGDANYLLGTLQKLCAY